MAGDVEEVLEVLVSVSQERPDGAGAFIHVKGLALFRVIAQEGAVQTGVRVLNQLHLHEQHKLSSSASTSGRDLQQTI